MKQTAVEWLELHLFIDDNWKRIFEQAKEMEKEQIIEAYYYDPNSNEIKDDGEEYYKKTFKKY